MSNDEYDIGADLAAVADLDDLDIDFDDDDDAQGAGGDAIELDDDDRNALAAVLEGASPGGSPGSPGSTAGSPKRSPTRSASPKGSAGSPKGADGSPSSEIDALLAELSELMGDVGGSPSGSPGSASGSASSASPGSPVRSPGAEMDAVLTELRELMGEPTGGSPRATDDVLAALEEAALSPKAALDAGSPARSPSVGSPARSPSVGDVLREFDGVTGSPSSPASPGRAKSPAADVADQCRAEAMAEAEREEAVTDQCRAEAMAEAERKKAVTDQCRAEAMEDGERPKRRRASKRSAKEDKGSGKAKAGGAALFTALRRVLAASDGVTALVVEHARLGGGAPTAELRARVDEAVQNVRALEAELVAQVGDGDAPEDVIDTARRAVERAVAEQMALHTRASTVDAPETETEASPERSPAKSPGAGSPYRSPKRSPAIRPQPAGSPRSPTSVMKLTTGGLASMIGRATPARASSPAPHFETSRLFVPTRANMPPGAYARVLEVLGIEGEPRSANQVLERLFSVLGIQAHAGDGIDAAHAPASALAGDAKAILAARLGRAGRRGTLSGGAGGRVLSLSEADGDGVEPLGYALVETAAGRAQPPAIKADGRTVWQPGTALSMITIVAAPLEGSAPVLSASPFEPSRARTLQSDDAVAVVARRDADISEHTQMLAALALNSAVGTFSFVRVPAALPGGGGPDQDFAAALRLFGYQPLFRVRPGVAGFDAEVAQFINAPGVFTVDGKIPAGHYIMCRPVHTGTKGEAERTLLFIDLAYRVLFPYSG